MMKRVFLAAGMCLALGLGAATAQPLPKVQLQPVFSALSLSCPVWMSEAPDGSGRFFIVEQDGRILIVQKGSDGSQPKVFLDIVDRHPHNGMEEGLLSMAFHPGFKTNGLFYIYYNQLNETDGHSQEGVQYPRRSVISEFHVANDDPNRADMSSERILLEVPQPYSNHKGGELCFGPDGYLYLGLGDGGRADDPFNNGQNTATLLAKMLRIDVNRREELDFGRYHHELPYGYPPDNPYIHEPAMYGLGPRKEIFAIGLRNPWRYSFDRQTGDLWVGDVGQDLWEEVDLLTNGGNYGWCVREGAHYFKPAPPGAQYIDPVMEYPHKPELLSQSLFPNHTIGYCIIGGYVYRGQKYPALQGIYVYGDYNLGTIWGMRYKNGKVTDQDAMLFQPKNIASFAEDQEGELYVLTGSYHPGAIEGESDGRIFALTVAQ
jgi:glucose/arabinose dehydrogenase